MAPANPATALRRAAFAAVIPVVLAATTRADVCPTSTFQLSSMPPEEIAGPGASGTRSDDYHGTNGTFYFRGYGDSVAISATTGFGGWAKFTVRGRYRFLGPPPGTWVSNIVRVHNTGNLHGYQGDVCTNTSVAVAALEDQGVMASGIWFDEIPPFPWDYCFRMFSDTLSFKCEHQAGAEFGIAESLQVWLAAGSESGQVSAALYPGPLPPGVIMVRCNGDTTVQLVVGVGPSSVSSLRIDAIRPNPARGSFQASVSLPAGGPTIVRLLDVSGRVVETRIVDAPSGARRELSLGGALAPGTYFLQAKRGAVTAVGQVVIRR